MPDIDVDFCYVRRGEVIDYVVRKYGREKVSQIITFGTIGRQRLPYAMSEECLSFLMQRQTG